MDRLVAIGDIHGCVHTLKDLLNRVSYSSQTDTLVFIGDYIDRGYFSYEVVDMLIKLQHQVGKDKLCASEGTMNRWRLTHTDMVIIRSGIEMAGAQLNTALRKTGRILLTRFHGLRHCHLSTTLQRLSSVMPAYPTPCCKITARKIFCGDATGIRTDTEEREKQVVFGHTPRGGGRAYTVPTGDICIDAGCVFGGRLCALVVQDDGKAPVCM